VSVIVDLGGNDRYMGSDVAIRALSAIVDLAGDDRYEMQGSGLGAAIAGASLVIDFAGNDSYAAKYFGLGAAALGFGALLDLAGEDVYRIEAWGEGFGLAGGTGLLWDRRGNDRYSAGGIPDLFERGAGLSGAQGASFGARGRLGGGIGILRDDEGDDVYEAQMFAQGSGYYYALGLLWDRAGADRYRAHRYAQGNAAHQALGVLRDDGGDDSYAADWYAQGMGLDVAVGVLFDAAGADSFSARGVSQGTATANGFGLIAASAGRFSIATETTAWGEAQWLRGLPSVGMLLADRAQAKFTRSTVQVPPQFTGKQEPEPGPDCKAANTEAVRAIIADPARHLGAPELPCALAAATPEELANIWTAFDTALSLPNAPFLQPIAYALKERPGPDALMQKLSEILKNHPRCVARALWAGTWASADEAREVLDSPCWRLQAAALDRLKALGVTPPASESRPSFFRNE